jgi:5-(carboxyamino)imidazole ribonucleotide synthase
MAQYISSEFKLGIICGGQLGKMLALAAANWDVTTSVLDASEDCPAGKVSNLYTKGHHMDFDAVYNFGQTVDMITFEIEHVNLEALRKLKSEGKKIYPDPELLAIIQDKGIQKQFYAKHNIPSSNFDLYESKDEILAAITSGKIVYPFVQKSRTAGYDGKGVAVIRSESDLGLLLDGPAVVEDAVDIDKELSIIISRNVSGEVKCYPLVEMEFSETANLVELLLSPADVNKEIEAISEKIAVQVAEGLDLVGIMAVELFLNKNGEILVNESAPRTHNSGHQTIEGNVTSQYEQQIRAILDMPLGDTSLRTPSVMINLLGEPNYAGPVYYEGFNEILKVSGVNPHIYGKRETRPFRKMGHITVIDESLEGAISKANLIKKTIKVISK